MRSDALQSLDDLDEGIEPPEMEYSGVRILRPDHETAKITAFENLSEEARFVMDIVLRTPADAAEYICSATTDAVTRKGVVKYLRRILEWDEVRVRGVFSELADYVKQL